MFRSTSSLLWLLLQLFSALCPCVAIPRPVAGTSWRLHSMALPTGAIDDAGDESKQLSPILPDTEITARFGDDGSQESGVVDGSGGCGHYFARFEVDLSTMGITFGKVGASPAYCYGGGIMEQQDAYYETLGKVKKHAIFGDKLELRDENGVLLLSFVPLDTNVDGDVEYSTLPFAEDDAINGLLAGSRWVAAFYRQDRERGLVPILAGTTLALTFESGDALKGNGGCNDYFGSYAEKYVGTYDYVGSSPRYLGGRLAIFDLNWTEMGCTPLEILDQEVAYFAALQQTSDYRISQRGEDETDEMLELLDEAGGVIVKLHSAARSDQGHVDIKSLSEETPSSPGAKKKVTTTKILFFFTVVGTQIASLACDLM